ncbi:MAG: hypothetical protein P8J55_08095 [Pseudomonadales bacterium]|nr:hypothetical protein [Pseudomonadales bacterium]
MPADVPLPDVHRQPSLIQVGEKRNLVYLYAEGLERMFLHPQFGELMPRLNALMESGTQFTNSGMAWRTNWTIPGMTASQCGIPFVTSSLGNASRGMDVFLPNIVCLSNLLHEQRYRNEYLSGSSVEFGGTAEYS